MMTRIAGNSGKRNGKSFRMNAGAANFYVILHVVCRLTRLLTIRATIHVKTCQESWQVGIRLTQVAPICSMRAWWKRNTPRI